MAFKIKDLMVHVLPSDPLACGSTQAAAPLHAPILVPVVLWGACQRLSLQMAQFTCGETIGPTDFVLQNEQSAPALAALKEQLKRQLAEVETRQTAAEASMQPQTVEQVDMLTNKLTDALQELKGRRAELSKKSKSAQNK